MRLLDEWRFHFTVETPEPVDAAVLDELMWDVCVGWAEGNGFYIGGGIHSDPDRRAGMSAKWVADFGFYTQRENELTSELDASGLWASIAQWCSQRGYRLTGGFDAFPPDESEST